ncbi:3-hydroxybenzoate 6-hydroxylase [Emericellopsis cladophorae]|uniref:3-hydroxybenzoate 6-hydroxylase n=1 Tax=Emericellopsis cladophorae TaxID=2686198 RepID=A0A9P9XVT9_9HYPO|nr:3-hydroxybenzoate 6-hydroxylase [Emericellopsis cladophorae]KAI6778751.1 3-hydroxybenzoate 6-hydroxylase [Emericellopsis cladophorae]
MAQPNFHVCIVGAGIVGLASSILLLRDGFEVTLLEKDGSLQASSSIQTLSGFYKTSEYTTESRRNRFRPLQDRYGAPVVAVHRAFLRQVLYDEAVARGANVRLGTAVKLEASDLKHGVLKISESESICADLFIGADGANSALREAITGRKLKLIPHGFVVYRILIDESLIQAQPSLQHFVEEPVITVWLGPKSQAITYSLHGLFNIAFTRPWSDEPFYTPQKGDLDEFRAELKAEGWATELQELIGLATECHRWMFIEPEIDDENTPWVDESGRAQGAAMGLESASILAHVLNNAKGHAQTGAALRVYEVLRKERSARIIRASLKNGRLWQLPNGPLQRERDRELRNDTPSAGFPNLLADPFFQEWLWGFDATKAMDEASTF